MTTSAPPTSARPEPPTAREPYAVVGRSRNEGHGKRLTAAFEALEVFPALAESRNRLLRVVSQERVSAGEVVAAVESDVALVIAVLRLANQVEGKSRGRVESIVEAVDGPRNRNTSVHVGPDGSVKAVYRKLHMFNAPGERVMMGLVERGLVAVEVLILFALAMRLLRITAPAIRGAATGDVLSIDVSDDGAGFGVPGRGTGLTNTRDRVEALGGRLRIDSRPGAGTRLHVELPLTRPTPAHA